ncbi:DUF2199 domain-containing protein [Nocardia sp. GCM10030253]|uniref:DUF2199 domain-containing protein n=1 Tax=Nocardia sp. GCM10030253 TaxID=3273404 RepID=UPI003626B9C2
MSPNVIRRLRPEALIGLPDKDMVSPIADMILAKGHGAFLRCLLPVRLTGGVELVFGSWMKISGADAERAFQVWDSPAYANLRVSGTLANIIQPWDVLGTPVTAEVRDEGELPYITSHSPLAQEWGRDFVLSHIPRPLPIPIREALADQWTVERSEWMSSSVEGRTVRFAGQGRYVELDVYGDRAERSLDDSGEFCRAPLQATPTACHSLI